MLPTSGYFRGISCPEHEKSYCHRPYCHFRHNPKKEMPDEAPQSSISTPDVEVDGTSSSHETLGVPPMNSNTDTEIVKEFGSMEQQVEDSDQEEQSGPNEEKQSELLQHLVSEAVKKVLAENPLLTTSGIDHSLVVKGIDTSALAAHAAAEVTQANTRLKKKYYFRPPDTPSYNPTPIEELNKRKRSGDYNEDLSTSKAKALKYTPSPIIPVSTLQNASESEHNSKESIESEVTDFSSDEADEDVDKRKCDFDILEEVLAEHSQNNKVRVKKKKVKALGKPHYSLNIPDRKVDESSMISDARNMSDQDSNSCDMPVTSAENKVPNEGSYFLPPSPVFTSSSDGFGAFSSVVYTKPSTSPEECESGENKAIDKKTVQNLKENNEKEESTHAIKQSNLLAKAEKKRICKEDIKKGAKGHTHLPQVVHTLGAPKLSRPNIRNWTPQVRSTTSDSKREGDPLEEMLQLMDGNDGSKKEKSKEGSKNLPAVSGHHASPKNKKKYKVDLDKEIESLTNSSANKKGLDLEDKSDLFSKESNKIAEASHRNESEPETKESSKVGERNNARKNLENETYENEKNLKMVVNEKVKASESGTPDSGSEDESNDSSSIDKTADDSDSEHERKRHKKKRKRSPSSSFESDHSHHRKKRKKYHKRHRKQNRSKKRRKQKDRKSHSSHNDEKLMKDDKDDDDDENKNETSGDILKDESDKTKKGKKHKKRNKHKKAKYKRKKSKSKPKKKINKSHSRSKSSSVSRSLSSSSNRSRSSSSNRSRSSRSRSSSKYQSRSSSRHRSRSSSRQSSRCSSNNRSKSPSKGKSEISKPQHKGGCDLKSQNESSSVHRSRSSSRCSSASSGKYRSRNLSKNRSKSPSKSRSENSNQKRSHSRNKNSYTHKSRHREESGDKSSSESSINDRSRSSSKNRSRSSSNDRSRSSSKERSSSSSKDRSRSSSRYRSRSRSLSKNRSKSPSKDKGENVNRSRSHSRSNSNYGHKSQHKKEMVTRSQNERSSKHRSRSSSRHRSRSSSKCRSENVGKNQSQSLSKGRGENEIRSRSRSKSNVSHDHKSQHRKGVNAKTQSGSNVLTKESHHTNSQILSTPMPIDPSKIKVEKEELIPDLSLVKTEKLDSEESPGISFKKEKLNNYSEVNTKSDNVDDKKIDAGNQKSSKDASKNLESFRKDKEHLRLSSDKVSKRRDSHERKNSTDIISEKSSTSDRRCSIDSKKSDNEISYEKKKLEDRRTSTEKNKKEKVSSPKSDSYSKHMSMFDLVTASTQPPKPKALTEISIFEAVTNTQNEDIDSSSASSDDEAEQRNYDFKTQKHSTQEVCSDQKHNISHSIVRSKTELSSKIDKINDHPRSESARHSHRSVNNRIDSNSKGNKSDSKHTHSSSTKDKKYSHHISSSSHEVSNSSHHKSGGGGSSSSSKQHTSSSSSSKQHSSSSGSSKQHPSGSIITSSTTTKLIHSNKSKEGNSDISSTSHCRGKHSSSKHHHSSMRSSSKHISGSKHKDLEDKRISINRTIRTKKEYKTDEITKTKKTANVDDVMKVKKAIKTEESSDGISDRDLYNYNDYPDSDTGNESPLPDLSVLDEIPEDDWEQMISSSDKVDSRNFQNLENYEESDIEDLDRDDPQVMEECMKMFNDYHPAPEDLETQPSSKKARMKSIDEEPDPLPGKQRISRSNSTGNLLPKKPNFHQHRKTPAQMMMERYKKLKEQQAELMKQLEKQKQQLEEQSRGGSSSAVSSTTSAKPNVSPASSSTSIMSPPHSSLSGIKRRISHVPNVSSLLTAREKIKHLSPPNTRLLLSPSVSKASGAVPQTHAQTVPKGEKRVAHASRPEMLARPIIQAEFGSKVPQNIRQRYLNLLIDECLKFCGEVDAYNIAVAEECVCVKRASSRMVYLNLAVNAVKRLRTQQKAGEAAQELLDKEPQYSESLSVEEPSTSSVSSSTSRDIKPHPTNPNHVRLSHFTVLAGGGQKGSWSIEKPKKNSQDIQDSLKGEAFYKHLKKYIMTEDQLLENGYPSPDPNEKGKAIIKKVDGRKKISPSSVERYCDRCSVLYMVDKWGFPICTGPCVYHWGRAYKRRSYGGPEARYSCCGGDLESEGCCQAVTHVSQNFSPNNLHGYVRTLPKDIKGNDYGVYALDCEMCYTTGGNELTRVTVINIEGNIVYEHLVKPENPIIDYNTRFSGITESDLQDVKTTLLDVQAAFLTRFSDKTILIGHSLESDFQALKLIHDTVVDTSVVFPHKMGAPYKRALRNLASEYLKKIIQNDVSGHDSAEDATTCMHLMQWKVKEDIKGMK